MPFSPELNYTPETSGRLHETPPGDSYCSPFVLRVATYDSPFVLRSLTAMLTGSTNIEILDGVDLAEPDASVRERIPHVVILGITQFHAGIDTLRRIKSGLNNPVVIVMMNSSETIYRNVWRSEGADFFLDKSMGLELLMDILDLVSALHKRNARLT